MKEFTPQSKISEIRNCKEFAPFKKYVVCPRQFAAMMGPLTLEKLTQYFPFDPPSLCNALNEMRLRRQRGEQLFYDLGDTVGLYAFLIGKRAPLVLILPGGGYGDVCSFVEGFSTAARFNELGFNAVIGQYHVRKRAHYPAPQEDVAAILSFVFSHAEKWQVDTENLPSAGFRRAVTLRAVGALQSSAMKSTTFPSPPPCFCVIPSSRWGKRRMQARARSSSGKRRKIRRFKGSGRSKSGWMQLILLPSFGSAPKTTPCPLKTAS